MPVRRILVHALGLISLLLPLSQTETSEARGKVSSYNMFNSYRSELSRARLILQLEGLKDVSDEFSFDLGARAFVDPAISPSSPYPDAVKEDEGRDIELRKFYLSYRKLPFSLKIGMQEVVWGEALHYFSADLLHPKDYRDGLINDLSWARRPQTGIWTSYEGNDWSLQAVYFPVSVLNRYPKAGAEFSIPAYDVESLGIRGTSDEGLFQFDEPTAGANLGLKVSGWELHLLASLLRDPQRTFQISTNQYRHDRIFQTGMTASYAWDSVLLRAESTLIPSRDLNHLDSNGQLGIHQVGEVNSLLALEISEIEDLILTAQAYLNQRYHCRESQLLTCRTLQESVGILWMNLPWDLEFESRVWMEWRDPSAWWTSRLKRNFGDHLETSLGLEQFLGPADGRSVFAHFRNKDQILFRADYSF